MKGSVFKMREHESEELEIYSDGILAKGFGLAPKLVMTDKRLSIQAKGLYCYLSSFVNQADELKSAYPKRQRILDDLQIGLAFFYRIRKELEQVGLIKISIIQSRFGRKTIYFLPTNPTPPQHSKKQNPCIDPCTPREHMAQTQPQNSCSKPCSVSEYMAEKTDPCTPREHMAHPPQNPCSEGCEQSKPQVKAMYSERAHAIHNNTSSIYNNTNDNININNNIYSPDYRQERRDAPEPPQAAEPNGKNENDENIKSFQNLFNNAIRAKKQNENKSLNAYLNLLKEGNTPKEIETAYQRYATTYAQEHGCNYRYALDLSSWLTNKGKGFEVWKNINKPQIIAQKSKEEQEREEFRQRSSIDWDALEEEIKKRTITVYNN